MMVPTATFDLTGDGPEFRASAADLLKLASGDDFARWEEQLAATGNSPTPCACTAASTPSTWPPAKGQHL